jgi:hypothetical protein
VTNCDQKKKYGLWVPLPRTHAQENTIEVYASVSGILLFLYLTNIYDCDSFSRQSQCFMDAYHHGLNGKLSAWAAKKYWGH